MNATMTLPTPGKKPAFLWYPKDAITDNCRALNCEAYGFYMRLLEHSWINDGIPADLEFLEDLAKNAFGLSKYKFHKMWPKVKNFFVEIDGVLVNGRQERERSQVSEFRAKQREKSKIANRVRWGSQPVQNPLDFPNPISEQSPRGSSGDVPGIPEPSLFTPTRNILEGVPAASASSTPTEADEGAAAVPPAAITDTEHEAIATRSAELGMQAPDRKTAAAILRRHPTIPVSKFPRFPNQNSPGLWLHKTSLDLQLEIARQAATPPARKKSRAEEADDRLRALGRELDRKAASQ